MEKTVYTTEQIIERIQKLRALSQNAGTPAEAANATAKISKLLLEYNISEQKVNEHKPSGGIDSVKGKYDHYQTPYDGEFASFLLGTIAKFNFCKVVNNPVSKWEKVKVNEQKGGFTLIGKKYNVEIALYMFDYCTTQARLLFEAHWKIEKQYTSESRNVYKRSYLQGFIAAIGERLRNEREEAIKENEDQVMGIIKFNDAAVEARMNELFPKLIKGRAMVHSRSGDGKNNGYKDGKNLNLSKGLDGETKTTKQLY